MEQVARALGYLVYAVAAADHVVEEKEKQTIHNVMNENWQLLADQEDPFGVRALEFVDKLTAVLEEKELSTEDALALFRELFYAYPEKFTTEIKQFMLEICIKVANSFNQLNKSELVLLSRIEHELKGDRSSANESFS